jgi:radical SAM protein with 4Fe4S-binding SPASM domain
MTLKAEGAYQLRRRIPLRRRIHDKLPIATLRFGWELSKDIRSLSFKDWSSLQSGPPLGMHFNVTDRCNARCVFCAYPTTTPEGVMSQEIFGKALREYIQIGGTRISFNPLVGEPLLDPHIFERLRFALSFKQLERIDFFTNAINLGKDDNYRKLLDTGIREINLSIGGFERAQYVKIMGVRHYDEMLSGVYQLFEENSKRSEPAKINILIRGRMSSWFTDDFLRTVGSFIDDGYLRHNVHTTKLYDNWSGLVCVDDLPRGSGFYPLGHLRRRPCNRMFEVAVLVNGDLRACDCRFGAKGRHDELVFGNITQTSLAEAWDGERLRQLRKNFGARLGPKVCSACNVYSPIRK